MTTAVAPFENVTMAPLDPQEGKIKTVVSTNEQCTRYPRKNPRMDDEGAKRYPKQKPFEQSSVRTTSSSTESDVSISKRGPMKVGISRSNSNDSIGYDPHAYDPDDTSEQGEEGESGLIRQSVAFLGTDDESDHSVAYESVGAIRLDELLSSDEEGSLHEEEESEDMFQLGTLSVSHRSIQSEEIVFGGESTCSLDLMQACQDSTLSQSAISEAKDNSWVGDNRSLILRGSNEEGEGQMNQGKTKTVNETNVPTKRKSTKQTKKSKQGEMEKLNAGSYSWEDHATKMANNSNGKTSAAKKASNTTKVSTKRASKRKKSKHELEIEKLQDSLRSWEALPLPLPDKKASTATARANSTKKRASTSKKVTATTEKDSTKKPNNKTRKSKRGSEVDKLKDSLYSWEAHARRNSENSTGGNHAHRRSSESSTGKNQSHRRNSESSTGRQKTANLANANKVIKADSTANKPKQESEIEKLKAALNSWEGNTNKQATISSKKASPTTKKANKNPEEANTAQKSKQKSEILRLKESLNSWGATTTNNHAENTAQSANIPAKKAEDSSAEKAKAAHNAKQEKDIEKLKDALSSCEANTSTTKKARRASLKMEAKLNWWDKTTTSETLSPDLNIEEIAHIDLEIGQEFKPIDDFDVSQHTTRPTLQGHELSSASCYDEEALDAITSLRAVVPRQLKFYSEQQEEKSEEVEAKPSETEEDLERQSQSDSSDDIIPAALFNMSSKFRRSGNKDTDNNSQSQALTLSALATSSIWSDDMESSSPFAPTPEKPYGTHVVPRNTYRPTRYLTRGDDYDWDLTEEEIKEQVRNRRVLVCWASCGLILLGAAGGLMLYFLTPFGDVGPPV